jgi:hypothetical protein
MVAVIAPALRRGLNVLVYDGSGQGMVTRKQRLVFPTRYGEFGQTSCELHSEPG